MKAPTLSVVLPMRNEAASLVPLLARLRSTLERLDLCFEIIAIDDGSTDATLQKLRCAAGDWPALRAVSFSRNFGKEVALAAGLRLARGDAVMLMDADLQHPPEVIPDFVARWRGGARMVVGTRRSRAGEPLLRRLAARAFYGLFARLGSVALDCGGDFRLLDRRAVDVMNALPERTRFTKGLYAWLGFASATVPYDVAPRHGGRSNWNTHSLVQHSLDGILSFSAVPLRVGSVLGGFLTLVATLFGAGMINSSLAYGGAPPGWTVVVVVLMFFSGLQLMSLGMIGEYIGLICTEVRRRPLYVIADSVGFERELVQPSPRFGGLEGTAPHDEWAAEPEWELGCPVSGHTHPPSAM